MNLASFTGFKFPLKSNKTSNLIFRIKINLNSSVVSLDQNYCNQEILKILDEIQNQSIKWDTIEIFNTTKVNLLTSKTLI